MTLFHPCFDTHTTLQCAMQHILHWQCSHSSLTMAHCTTCFTLSLTDATHCLQYCSQYLTHLPSTHTSHLGDLQSSRQPTHVHINTYWTHPAAHSAVCDLHLWNSILSASATRGVPLGYFLFDQTPLFSFTSTNLQGSGNIQLRTRSVGLCSKGAFFLS